ncbi:MAG: aspartate carbamoyltransferase catalytic subunit [Patescibacteria group bacterium]
MNTNIITTDNFTRSWIEQVHTRSAALIKNGFQATLSGKIITTCFFEPSTRTRLSFTSAAQRLGASVLGFDSVTSTSTTKGESLEDTIRMVSNYGDVIVMRHPEAGSADRAAQVAGVPVINAGDGANQHPSQTLLDLFTIKQGIGRLDDFTILMIGDIEHSRVVHSLSTTLKLFNNVEQLLINPLTQDYKPHLNKADIILVTRVQTERFTDKHQADLLQNSYKISLQDVEAMKPTCKIISPLPRTSELPTNIDAVPQAYYFQQASFGVPVRAALLENVLGVW